VIDRLDISTVNEECLRLLQGCEFHSETFECFVWIRQRDVISNGDVVARINDDSLIDTLWSEMVAQNGINDELVEMLKQSLKETKWKN
jgi:hypothetical protein